MFYFSNRCINSHFGKHKLKMFCDSFLTKEIMGLRDFVAATVCGLIVQKVAGCQSSNTKLCSVRSQRASDGNTKMMWLFIKTLERRIFWFAVKLVLVYHRHDKQCNLKLSLLLESIS